MRTRYFSSQHNTLLLEGDQGVQLVRLDRADDVNRLFTQLKFPTGHVGSGIIFAEEPTGPRVLLHRTYLQSMPGSRERTRLLWCCHLRPDRDPEEPAVLTPTEAAERYGIKP